MSHPLFISIGYGDDIFFAVYLAKVGIGTDCILAIIVGNGIDIFSVTNDINVPHFHLPFMNKARATTPKPR